jgi:Sulfotransferase domain
LDQLIPHSKFILSVRDEESWYLSVKNHIGPLIRSAEHEWIYGRGKGLPKDDKENTINVYSKHNQEVIEYFKDRPDDLIIIDFTKGDKWGKLCHFLNKEIPNDPFPHINNFKIRSPNSKVSLVKIARKRIKNNLKIWYIYTLKLWDSGKSTGGTKT